MSTINTSGFDSIAQAWSACRRDTRKQKDSEILTILSSFEKVTADAQSANCADEKDLALNNDAANSNDHDETEAEKYTQTNRESTSSVRGESENEQGPTAPKTIKDLRNEISDLLQGLCPKPHGRAEQQQDFEEFLSGYAPSDVLEALDIPPDMAEFWRLKALADSVKRMNKYALIEDLQGELKRNEAIQKLHDLIEEEQVPAFPALMRQEQCLTLQEFFEYCPNPNEAEIEFLGHYLDLNQEEIRAFFVGKRRENKTALIQRASAQGTTVFKRPAGILDRTMVRDHITRPDDPEIEQNPLRGLDNPNRSGKAA